MQLGARLHVDACVAAGAGGDSVDGILRRGLIVVSIFFSIIHIYPQYTIVVSIFFSIIPIVHLDSAAVAQSAQPAAGASRPRMESAWELHAVPLKGLLASVSAGYRW